MGGKLKKPVLKDGSGSPLPQDVGKGGLSLRGVAFVTVSTVMGLLESTLLALLLVLSDPTEIPPPPIARQV